MLATAQPPSAEHATEERARLSEERRLARERDTRTREERLASTTLLDYYDAADVLDVRPQSVRAMMHKRNQHITAEGAPRWYDIPEPPVWRKKEPRKEPRWPEGEFRAWAIKVGKLDESDALTPQRPRPTGRPKGAKNKPEELRRRRNTKKRPTKET